MNVFQITDNNPIQGEAIKMTNIQMQKEVNYYMAQKLLKQLLSAGLISLDEFDKITELNRKRFSPLLAKIMP
jgi:predicted transcriptional regulator